MPPGTARRYRFATYRLDTRSRELREGGGAPVPLTAKAFDTLAYLIEHRDHVVSRDELLGAVWAGRVVEENTLTQAIAALRRAFGTQGGEHRFIVTVPGRGYQFVADVQEDDGAPTTPHVLAAVPPEAKRIRRPMLAAVALVLLVAIGAVAAWRMRTPAVEPARADATLAVLPFRSLSPDAQDEMLSLGLADALITRIGSSTSLQVRSLASSRRFGDADPLDAGRRLSARYVVEGTTQRGGDRIRVSARLIDVQKDRTLWSGTFDERSGNVFMLQDTLAAAMTDALALTRTDVAVRSPCDGENAVAYREYLSGRYQLDRPSGPRMRQALTAFARTIDLDPTCARAYAGMAYAYRASVMTGDADPRVAFPLAQAAIARALAIDPRLAEAYSSQGFVQFWYDWDWQAAEASLKHAIELNPSLAEAHLAYAHLLSNIGRLPEAAVQARQAYALNPLSPLVCMLASSFLEEAGHAEEAQRIRATALDIEPDYWVTMIARGRMRIGSGDRAGGLAQIRRAAQLCGDCSFALAGLVNGELDAGNRAAAERIRDALDARARTGYVPASNLALVHNALGDAEGALALLERGYRERDARMTFIRVDPAWDNLRKDPRFAALMARMNFAGTRALDPPPTPAPDQKEYVIDNAKVRGAP
ncbi:Transcriptional regulator [Lysobacter dokdonensis DS-58]|uniref:Transcriptional regulator n=1 Tax=Lysobacter dokdonensis DS-58 TaxID=1300345 RepID=A0A0A2WPD4_9GAMM|nr:winged helix-turn-helix domain-containing protein [Lysobacter dokdonensis]KGQ20597.1 Transcriptional regulator [Lysobacter dokdonensis DS-58]